MNEPDGASPDATHGPQGGSPPSEPRAITLPPRLHPPIVQRPIPVVQGPSRWPGVIGTICIVLGALGMLSSAWGVLQQLFMSRLVAVVPGQESMIEVYTRWMIPMVGAFAPGILVAGVLLYAGIKLVRRRPRARAACLAYAALRIVQGLILAVVTGMMQQELFQVSMAVTAAGSPAAAGIAAPMSAGMAILSVAAVALWAMAFPIFLIVWFQRPSIRREVRMWTGPVAVARPGAVGQPESR